MKLMRCPNCRSHLHLDSLVQDAAGKNLLAIVAKLPSFLTGPMIGYISLFRPEKSDLNNDRATKLIAEVLEITTNTKALAAALDQTTQQILTKRRGGTAQPVKNHSYLQKVLETLEPQFKQVMANTEKHQDSTVEVKNPGMRESKAENQAKFDEQMAKFRR